MRNPPTDEMTQKHPLMLLFPAIILVSMPWVGCAPEPAGQEPEQQEDSNLPKIMAVVSGSEIPQDKVLQAADQKLEKLQMERLQFEAKYKKGHFEALQSSLEDLVQQELTRREAEERSIEVKELLETEVQSKVAEPGEKEITTLYEANKKRPGKPLKEVEPQIRQYLKQQSYNQSYQQFVARLKEKYNVEYFLQPPRADIAVEGSPSEGPKDAPVTLVEFSDFQCHYCSRMQPTLKRIKDTYGEKVRLVFRQFPLNSIHTQAQKAAEASLCADDQGRFWEMHDKLFETDTSLKLDDLRGRATSLELNLEEFNRCLDSGKYAATVQQDVLDGVKAGVTGTPALFINGLSFSGARSFEDISEVIETELQKNASLPEG